jgi:hypothetical protein
MKALTLTQPWASLMYLGRKSIETRSWSTKYRGLLVIHAAKGFPKWARETCAEPEFAQALGGATAASLPLSRGLCVVRIIDCIPTEDIADDYLEQFNEKPFGDYSPGRYAWVTEFVRPLNDDRIIRGALGLWEWPEA